MNNKNKDRVKSAHFADDSIATVIPSSRNYKYDPGEEHPRKDAVEEFQSKRVTYSVAIVIGVLVFIVGLVLIWVGSHFELRDFFVLGPMVLCMGLGLAVGGGVFLCLSIRNSKRANTRVANGNYPSGSRVADTPTAELRDHSFVTTSDVNMDMASPWAEDGRADLYGSQDQLVEGEDEDKSFVVMTGHHPKAVELYSSSHVTPEPTQPIDTHRTSTPSGGDPKKRVNTPEGEVYIISLPNETFHSDVEGSSNLDSSHDGSTVPGPACYLEPNTYNNDSAVTSL